jgi:hypothetical protein
VTSFTSTADKPPSGIFERNSRGATPYALKQQLLLHLYLADLHDGLILGRNVGKDFGRAGPKRNLERLQFMLDAFRQNRQPDLSKFQSEMPCKE